MPLRDTLPDRQRAYLTTSIALRFAWVFLAIANGIVHGLEVHAFTAELLVMVLLTYDTHPHLTKSFDPEPDGGSNVFLANTWVKGLVTVAVVAYFAALAEPAPIHLPHSVEVLLHELVPSTERAFRILGGELFAFTLLFGAVLYRIEPDGAVIARVVRADRGIEPGDRSADQRELEAALAAASRSAWQWVTVLVVTFMVGFQIAVAALVFTIGFLALFFVPKLLVVLVVGWVVHDLLAHQFDLEGGLARFVREVGEEIEEPKRWFLELEMVESGLKGIVVTMFVLFGVLMAAGMGSFVLTVAYGMVVSFASVFDFIGTTLAAEGLPAITADLDRTLAVVYAVVLLPAIGLLFFVISATGAVVWYAILDRLPHWTKHYYYTSRQTESAVVRPIPRGLVLAYGLAWAVFPYIEWVLLPSVPQEADALNLVMGGPLLGLLLIEVVAASALWGTIRSFDRRTVGPHNLDLDNHRVLGLFLVPFVAVAGTDILPSEVTMTIIAISIVGYYLPDFSREVEDRFDSEVRITALTQAYVGIGLLIVYRSGILESFEGAVMVEYLTGFVVVLFLVNWITVLTLE